MKILTKAELDLRVAVEIMGSNCLALKKVPKYSSDLGEAFKVWDVLRQKGHRWLLVSSEQGFFLRHLASVSHDLDQDEKNYRADRPMGLVASNPRELARMICEVALQENK